MSSGGSSHGEGRHTKLTMAKTSGLLQAVELNSKTTAATASSPLLPLFGAQ